jgi:hypothetical protein
MMFVNKLENHKISNIQYITFLLQLQRNVNCKAILYVNSCEGLTKSDAGVQNAQDFCHGIRIVKIPRIFYVSKIGSTFPLPRLIMTTSLPSLLVFLFFVFWEEAVH